MTNWTNENSKVEESRTHGMDKRNGRGEQKHCERALTLGTQAASVCNGTAEFGKHFFAIASNRAHKGDSDRPNGRAVQLSSVCLRSVYLSIYVCLHPFRSVTFGQVQTHPSSARPQPTTAFHLTSWRLRHARDFASIVQCRGVVR